MSLFVNSSENKPTIRPGGYEGRKELHMAIGTYVTNFGTLGIIREIKADGSLVLENPRIGKWIADPEKCRPYEEERS